MPIGLNRLIIGSITFEIQIWLFLPCEPVRHMRNGCFIGDAAVRGNQSFPLGAMLGCTPTQAWLLCHHACGTQSPLQSCHNLSYPRASSREPARSVLAMQHARPRKCCIGAGQEMQQVFMFADLQVSKKHVRRRKIWQQHMLQLSMRTCMSLRRLTCFLDTNTQLPIHQLPTAQTGYT